MQFFTTGLDPRWWLSEPCLEQTWFKHPVPLRALFYLPSRLVLWHCSTWNLHGKRHVGWSQLCALSLHRFRKFSHATDPTCNMSCMNSVWSFFTYCTNINKSVKCAQKTMAPPHSSIYHMQKHLQGQMKMFDGAFFGLTALQTNMAMENTLPRKRTRKPLPPMPARTLHDCWVKSCGKSSDRTVCINGRPHGQPEVLQLPVGALQYAVVILHGEEFAPLNNVSFKVFRESQNTTLCH